MIGLIVQVEIVSMEIMYMEYILFSNYCSAVSKVGPSLNAYWNIYI